MKDINTEPLFEMFQHLFALEWWDMFRHGEKGSRENKIPLLHLPNVSAQFLHSFCTVSAQFLPRPGIWIFLHTVFSMLLFSTSCVPTKSYSVLNLSDYRVNHTEDLSDSCSIIF